MDIINLTSKNYSEVLGGDKPIVVEFFAPWCGYCKRLSSTFDQIANENADKFTFAKMNIDDEEKLSDDLGIDIIPTIIVFKNGKAGLPLVNPESKARIVDLLKSTL